MTRYIDADDVRKAGYEVNEIPHFENVTDEGGSIKSVVSKIGLEYDGILEKSYKKGFEDGLKSKEVKPIIHGKWKVFKDEYGICATRFTCSCCKEDFVSEMDEKQTLELLKYCPNCGAKMDEGVKE